MSETTWDQVRAKVEGLGLKLKLHLEQEQDETDTTSTPGDTRAAIDDLGQKLQEALDGFGNAARDPAVRADMQDLGGLLRAAVMETFDDVGAKVDQTVNDVRNRKKGSESDNGAPDDLTPPAPADQS